MVTGLQFWNITNIASLSWLNSFSTLSDDYFILFSHISPFLSIYPLLSADHLTTDLIEKID